MNNLPSNTGHSRGRGRGIKKTNTANQALTTTPQQSYSNAASSSIGNPEAAGDARGAVRGKRVITSDVIRTRPVGLGSKVGAVGRPVTVQTNYFRVLTRPNWSIHQYRVDFYPESDSTQLRRSLLYEHCKLFGGYLFDGTILFCTTKFDKIPGKNHVLELTTKSRSGEYVNIKIKHVGIVEAADTQQFQILNLILRRAMERMKLQLVGRNLFDAKAKIALDKYFLELWPGYQTSIRQHEADVLLCTEITHKVMRTDTLYHILSETIRVSDDYQSAFKREVIGVIVLTDYNNHTYRIDDVDFKSSPRSKFKTKEGEISYVDYYKKRYNLIIRDIKQPLLVSLPTEKKVRGGENQIILLIPELARATGLTTDMRNNFQLMKGMGEHTRLTPQRRIERLHMFNKRLQSSRDSIEMLKSWNIDLDKNLVEVTARVLPPERIVFGNGKRYLCDSRADWTGELRHSQMFQQTDILRWCVITPRQSARETQEFVKLCIRAASGMKMRIAEPKYDEMPDDRVAHYSTAIDKATSKDPQMILVVIKTINEEKYSCIKKRTCVDRPVPSQVVTLRTIAPRPERASGLMSIALKVVIQMNAKLMGAPWMIELPLRGLMTVGFDVCHSSKDKNKSYGALVATMDLKTSTRYYSSVTEHMKGQELSNQMSMKMTGALRTYRDSHGALPERVVFFRDGVGDGQLAQVVNTEVKYLKDQLDRIYKSAGKEDGCRMAFIVVSKRINTRYFLNKRNPDPGTVVDDIITLPERYDFFLVSQSVRQGTVSPTSYNVIQDNMGLNADKLQMLSYKMTHLYYNWSGTCRVPAVCQYAHKLAFLVAESIHRAPSASLENHLYFL